MHLLTTKACFSRSVLAQCHGVNIIKTRKIVKRPFGCKIVKQQTKRPFCRKITQRPFCRTITKRPFCRKIVKRQNDAYNGRRTKYRKMRK